MKLLIDADSICYKVAWSCADIDDEDMICERADQFIQDRILDVVQHTDYSLFLSISSECFRNKITEHLPRAQQYKANRDNMERPRHLTLVREYLRDYWGASLCGLVEADDACAMAQIDATLVSKQTSATEIHEVRYQSVLVSIDKDLLQIPGMHFNYDKQESQFVSFDQGLRFFYTQILCGDRNDNVIGLRGIGPVKAARLVNKTATEHLWDMAVKTYKSFGRTEQECLMNAQLLWMWREVSDNYLWTPDYKIPIGRNDYDGEYYRQQRANDESEP